LNQGKKKRTVGLAPEGSIHNRPAAKTESEPVDKRRTKILLVLAASIFGVVVFVTHKIVSMHLTMIAMNHEAKQYVLGLQSVIHTTGTLPPPAITLEDRTSLLRASGVASLQSPLRPRQYVFPILDANSNWLFRIHSPDKDRAPVVVLIPEGLDGEYSVVLTESGPELVNSESVSDFPLNGRIVMSYGCRFFSVPDDMTAEQQSAFLRDFRNM